MINKNKYNKSMLVSEWDAAVQVLHFPTQVSQEAWPEEPHGTEWYGEGSTAWRGTNASGRASGSKGRGRGRGAKAWEHESYGHDGHGHWEQKLGRNRSRRFRGHAVTHVISP